MIATLVDRRQLTLDQAQWVQQRVGDSKRLLAMEIYASLLYQAGLPGREVYGQHGKRRSPQELGQALIEKGLLTAEREQELRFRARIAFDRDVRRRIDVFLEGRKQTPSPATQGEERSISQVVKLPGIFWRAMIKLDDPGNKCRFMFIIDGFYLLLVSFSYCFKFHLCWLFTLNAVLQERSPGKKDIFKIIFVIFNDAEVPE